MNKRKLDCNVVLDLLPLYHDNVVSETTQKLVDEHLENCESCRKEYESLTNEITIESDVNITKNKFKNTMRKYKRNRFIVSAISVIAICTLVIGGYFYQVQMPILNMKSNEITVHKAYKYKTEEGFKMFVLYSHPSIYYVKGVVTLDQTNKEDILEMNIKKPLIPQKNDNSIQNEEIWIYKFGYGSNDNGGVDYYDYDTVTFAGNTIWNVNENKDDFIPEYVYEYEKFIGSKGDVRAWETNVDNGYLTAQYSDGRIITWDLDGNRLYDSNMNNK